MKKNTPRNTASTRCTSFSPKTVLLSAAALGAFCAHPALAAAPDLSAAEIEALRQELHDMRVQQQAASARMETIESALNQLAGGAIAPAPEVIARPAQQSTAQSDATSPVTPSRLNMSGDLRLRYEGNFSDTATSRNRGVIRARLRADYQLNDWLKIGGRIGTGNPDDPNSDDVTLSAFADDLSVSLDQAYAAFSLGGAVVHGGKFPLPFKRTDLVWDGDVNPQGASVNYTSDLGGTKIDLAGLYFTIDEDVAGPDSDMLGAQIGLRTNAGGDFTLNGAVAYFDYSLSSLGGADAGDFRSNLLAMDGSYLSDFNLLNVNGGVIYSGFGARWPVSLSGDFVKNYGSATSEDTGYAVNVSAGRAKQQHDWRLGYGYMQSEVDAVFAAFSHDNLGLATNYKLHALTADYVLDDHLSLNATYYRYRPLHDIDASTIQSTEWLNRLRLNAVVTF